MSDTGASVGEAEIIVSADTTPAEAGVRSLFTKITSFGSGASNAIGGVVGKINLMGQALGPSSPLAGVAGPLSVIQTGFERIAQKEDLATTAGGRFKAMASTLTGVGVAIMGVAAAATAFGAPLQNANAALETSIRNTGDGSKGMSDYADAIGKADATGKRFGFTNADINQALSQLTAETRNPNEALKELTMTETLAAATHGSLSSAARQMGQIHAGMYRSLRQFGIQLPQIRNDTSKLADEERKLAEAGTAVGQAHERTAAYQAELTQSMAENQAKYTQAVEQDQQRLEIAQQSLANLQEKVAVEDKQQQENLAAAVEDSANRQAEAAQNLADLREKLRKGGSQDVENQMSMADAEARVNEAKVKVATSSGEAQQTAIEQLRNAQEQLTREGLRQKDQKVSDARAMSSAENQVESSTHAHNKALQAQSDFAIVAQQHQTDLQKAAMAVSTANAKLIDDQRKLQAAQAPTIAQAEKLKGLQEAEAKAGDKQAEAAQKVANIKGQQARLDAGFAEAQRQFMEREKGLLERREKTWAGHVAKIKASIMDLLQQSGKLAQPLFFIGGAATAIGGLANLGRGAAGAAGGILSKIKNIGGGGGGVVEAFEGAGVGRDASTGRFTKLGEEAEKAESKVGGSIGRMVTKFKEMGKGEEGFIKIGGGLEKMKSGMGGVAGKIGGFVSSVIGMGTSIASAGWTAIAPWLPLIAAIGGLILVGYLVYRNWDTIKKAIVAVWDDMWKAGKAVFNEIGKLIGGTVDWIKDHWKLLVELFVPGAQIFAVIDFFRDHWGDIWSDIKDFGADAWNFLITVLEDMVKGFTSTVSSIIGIGSHLPGFLGGNLFKDAAKGIDTLSDSVVKKLDSMKVDTGSAAKKVGQAITQGVSKGMVDAYGDINSASAGIIQAGNAQMAATGQIHSPSRLFAESIGKPIAQGVAMGMMNHANLVEAAGRRMMLQNFGAMPAYSPSIPTAAQGGSTLPTPAVDQSRGGIVHLEPHFHQEISPLHVAHELAWDARH